MAKEESKTIDKLVKDKGNLNTLEELRKQPTVKLQIPEDTLNSGKDNQFLPVIVNGTIYSIPRGVMVDVPQSIYEIVNQAVIQNKKVRESLEK